MGADWPSEAPEWSQRRRSCWSTAWVTGLVENGRADGRETSDITIPVERFFLVYEVPLG